ncbi:uncharacterized protein L3040_007240 [Drepanopeziza brunnea f. sp. 'multigermtubi']|uniref:Pheromone receptor a n=1 Tax=Marssonina brunnea f. sp. multigermtubi (strain MB_m1) TaxID=1072389 RepID=K1Y1X8_MARBU|nr:pheromone receptor a [Drepanopeziza brunnea f. sp. 'multigermtubi' MB_m1]EKD19129.1 pheromone receptor a [Drepanopeziza brunnea f. sp. 'multigermtubi' MB_m1]KAJ5038377.1 hypothetical protein L3040_007240 [Drepanopeziza brunnea f. sp. 'multigermtubi']
MENSDALPAFITTDTGVPPTVVANAANAIALPIFAVIALIITYLPLRSFYRVNNVAACSIIFVVNYVNLQTFVNALLWPNDDWSEWWIGYGVCDVESLFRFPITMALATSLCCLTKGLADALDTEHAVFNQTKAQRRRKLLGDVLFCWAIPVIQMALHYVVQAGRYMIAPVWGCGDQLDNSWPMLIIIIIWCPLFTLLNVYYAIIMLTRLYKHRRTISAALTSTGSGLAPRKFIKLVIISLSTMLIYLPVQSVFIWLAIPTSFVKYSWARVHNPVTWNPVLFIHTENQPSLQWNGWGGIAMAFSMFLFFGFNDDAVDSYRKWLVMCGAGKVWPSLKLSRDERRGSASGSGHGSGTFNSGGRSFGSRFDLVGKAMKYLDGDKRKDSQASTAMGGDTMISMNTRKGSQGTFFENTTPFDTTSTSVSSLQKMSPGSAYNPSSATSSTPLHPSTLPIHSTHSTHTRGFFSLFRTTVHLPFFAPSSPSPSSSSSPSPPGHHRSQPASPQDNRHKPTDRSSSHDPTSPLPHRTPAISPTPTTVSTSIWSSPSPSRSSSNNTHPHLHSRSHSNNSHFCTHSPFHAKPPTTTITTTDADDELGPGSPKMGTRAYRERERREMLRAAKGEKRTSDGAGKGGGVVKTTRVEVSEECVVAAP